MADEKKKCARCRKELAGSEHAYCAGCAKKEEAEVEEFSYREPSNWYATEALRRKR